MTIENTIPQDRVKALKDIKLTYIKKIKKYC